MRGESIYSEILGNIQEGVYFVDTERRITFWNKGAERITGYADSEVVGSCCHDNILRHVNDEGVLLCRHGCPLHKSLEDGQKREASVYLHHKSGHRVPVQITVLPMVEDEKVIGAVELFNDNCQIRELKDSVENLKALAMKDPLTNLANRRYTEIFLDAKMRELESLGMPFGLAFIDVDRFKDVNDTYGHKIGDEVLRMLAKTLCGVGRATDLIGRWGGEEFLAIFSGVSENDLWLLSEKIRMLVEYSSLEIDSLDIKVTISLGSTVVQTPVAIEDVIKRADSLMYRSKTEGRNRTSLG
jgi:diguanylate cyclase (GGDEF)-like protein/PAS domain S-box-containing protein